MTESAKQPTSGLAIAGLVLGIIAAVTSFLPIVNNLSAILAFIGGVLAVIALIGALKGKNGSKGLAIAGIVLAVVSFAIVLGTQSLYKKALDKAVEGPKVESATASQEATDASQQTTPDQAAPTASETPAQEAPAQEQPDFMNLAVGQTANLSNGLSITVNSVQLGLANYNGSLITGINVTIANNGSENESFSAYDWKGEDANGAQRSSAYYSEAADELNSGTLSPGGSVTGNIYFEDGTVRLLYYDNMFDKSPTAGWTIA